MSVVNDVRFHIEVADTEDAHGVTSVILKESLNAVPNGVVVALYGGALSANELLHKSCTLSIERQSQRRSYKGIVWHARVRETAGGTQATLHIAPAAMLLGKKVDSRIFQAKTVPEVIEEVYSMLLGGLQYTVRSELQRTYETREYVVQWQETCLAFISRLAEEAGIFWFFDHETELPTLVLADTVASLASARDDHDGTVPYSPHPEQLPDHEAAWNLVHHEQIGPTDVVLAEYDWTRPGLQIRGEMTGRGEHQPPLEIYDHTDAVVLHGYSGGRYGEDTSREQARLRALRLDLDRLRWEMDATVVTAQPGKLLRVDGCPDSDLDQQYVIVSSSSRGSGTAGADGTWHTTLELVPTARPYVPPARIARPIVPGPVSAQVVGPEGSEIHTDEHGRVRVHFHWDRDHGRTAEDSSCWIRVAQNWAGNGFGTFFQPRVGMEVLVSFLGGDPDSPIVTHCVYNGENRADVELDAKKTQSLIRTKSSPNSEGYNEIRFEDEAGGEFISVHAQKNLLERVLNNHTTRVGHDQTNTVDNDQTETIHGKREKTVDKDEKIVVKGTRDAFIGQDGGNEKLWVVNNQIIQVDGNRELLVAFGETVEVRGIQGLTIGSIDSTVRRGITQTIQAGGWTMTTTGNVSHTITGGMVVDTSDGVTINAGAQVSIDGAQGVTVSGQSITLRSNTQVEVVGPNGIRNLTPARRQNTSPSTMDTIADWIIDGGRKFSMYYLAVSIVTGMKVDVVMGAKVDNTRIKARLSNMQIENAAGAWLRKAAVSLLA